MAQHHTIIITCGKGIAKILQEEIEEYGYSVIAVHPFSVELKGSLKDCMFLNLHLRTANKVLMLIKRFKASHPDHLYKAISKIPWEDHIRSNGYVSVTSFIENRFILDTRFGNQKAKDAIVDRIFSQRGKRPDSGPKRDQAVVYLHWVQSDCHLYFDTSGETISKHGYRRIPFKAPLRESLAAALVRATKWTPDMPLVNPMAGSGTLAIEAAMMASKRAPGLGRSNFGFMHLKSYQQDEWLSLKEEAAKQVLPQIELTIIINDTSLEALRAAKKNAEWAGVKHLLKFDHGDFNEIQIPDPPGIVILNPEYGERLGDIATLGHTYKKIGDFYKEKCAGYWGYIFSGNPELSKRIGLRTSSKRPFFNGKIECRLLEYELYHGSKKMSDRIT
jgi:putative N6-adenine-specific DNA methylase